MMGLYRSVALLYYTISELRNLTEAKKQTNRIIALSKTIGELVHIMSIIAEYKELAFSNGLLLGPIAKLFISFSKSHYYSKSSQDSFSWKLRMLMTFMFLRRFVNKYRKLRRFKL